jgi:hypothetical protein
MLPPQNRRNKTSPTAPVAQYQSRDASTLIETRRATPDDVIIALGAAQCEAKYKHRLIQFPSAWRKIF